MKKTFRHTGVLMMVGVFALGLLGAAYTLWYEDLTLHADVSTGTFDADWSCEEDEGHQGNADPCDGASMPIASLNMGGSYHTAAQLAPITGQPLEVIESKLPRCDVNLSPPNIPGNPSNPGADLNQLDITMSNLYPYAGCEFWIDIHNDGTVPMHLSLMSQTWTGGAVLDALADNGGHGNGVVVTGGSNQSLCRDLIVGLNHPTGTPDVIGDDDGPLQLHAGDELICHFRWVLHQYNVEGQNATITLVFRAHQWNESLGGGPAPAAPGSSSFGN